MGLYDISISDITAADIPNCGVDLPSARIYASITVETTSSDTPSILYAKHDNGVRKFPGTFTCQSHSMKESIYLDIFAQMGATEPYFLCGLMGKLRDFSDKTEKHPMRSKGASAGWIRLQLEKISAPVDAVSGTREKQTFESAGLGSMVFCAWRHKQLKCQITLQELCTMVDENSRLNHATVLQLICRKDSHGLKHEFLLAEIELATSKHIWMRMERSAGERLAGTGGWASLSSEFSAHDPVTASATCDVLLEGSAPSKIMAEIQFTRKKPSLALLRQLLLSLLEKSPFYHLTTDNCWFFCTVILRILGERFDDSVRREKAPGWFRTLVGKGFEESLQKISKLFEERLRSGMAERRLPGLEQREETSTSNRTSIEHRDPTPVTDQVPTTRTGLKRSAVRKSHPKSSLLAPIKSKPVLAHASSRKPWRRSETSRTSKMDVDEDI